MDLKILETSSLKLHLKQYSLIFNGLFSTNYTPDFFLSKYSSGLNNSSIHSIAFDKKKIVGGFTIIPQYYKQSENQIILGLGCDAFVIPSYRSDEMLLYKLFKNLLPELRKKNVFGIISIPNPTAVKYWKLIAKWEIIDYLKIQVIPVNFKGIYTLSKMYIYSIYLLSKLLNKKEKDKQPTIRLDQSKEFLNNRYPDSIYKQHQGVYYREVEEGNILAAYVLGHSSLKSSDFLKLIISLMPKIKRSDFIMIGSNVNYFGFFTLSKRLIKRDFPVMYFGLDNSFTDLNANTNIEIDLSSFDNR